LVIQTLDIKQSCAGIFLDGEIITGHSAILEAIINRNIAWKHSPIFDDEDMFYLFPHIHGQQLEKFSANEEEYFQARFTIEAQKRASVMAGINLEDLCFFDLIPDTQLKKWLTLRGEALNSAKKVKRSSDYKILHKAHVLATTIEHQNISYMGTNTRVSYDIFGTATGRLSTKKESVPVMNLKKSDRVYVCPQNDLFVELDLNAAEVRTLLALSGEDQPAEDIHLWLKKRFFKESHTREEVKKKVFSWLYNFSAPENELSKIFSREIFRDFYCYDKGTLRTPYGRVLEVEERKAQNYLLQSTTSDIVIENSYKIMKRLKNMKSNVAFTLHDSVILDMTKDEAGVVRELHDQFQTTQWGKFLATCKVGKNFLDLKEVKI
jgi:hypothetical protein